VDPRTGLEDVQRTEMLPVPGPELRHPGHSPSLYLLCYPNALNIFLMQIISVFNTALLNYAKKRAEQRNTI
jgi:hypothetical protein